MPQSKMQFKTASLVALAVWFVGAINASVLSAHVGPVTDAAATHVLIHPILDSSLCIWGVITLKNAHIVQFQNTANNLCLKIPNDPFNREIVIVSGCTNSNGSGRPEFDTSPQTITTNNLPFMVTLLNNFIHFANTNFCMDHSGNVVLVNSCNGAVGQTWIMTLSG
ncbi:hypothetical protein DFH08DRAFT_964871 [Mycena albidolilacea]|uniref:Ricin B lectin domain-containing protein n=1 Tax=Mycena albidolilacea TaxID=1033008 RepID=A0AAD7EMX4_9AGAR|nr:hypothetical protein DFH08DRAFT_964871 [Mycena albidolilacea]